VKNARAPVIELKTVPREGRADHAVVESWGEYVPVVGVHSVAEPLGIGGMVNIGELSRVLLQIEPPRDVALLQHVELIGQLDFLGSLALGQAIQLAGL